jgi:hypothetical protein
MFQQAGIEIVLIILWVLFSIYGSVQQKKKRELAKQQPAKPVKPATDSETSTEEDPFKKMLEEMFGEKKLEQEIRTERTEEIREGRGEKARPFYESETNVPTADTYKKPVYKSISPDAKTATTMGGAYDLLDTADSAYQPLTSMLLPSQEGLPQTLGQASKKKQSDVPVVTRARPNRSSKFMLNGKEFSMKDAVTAQIILERRI